MREKTELNHRGISRKSIKLFPMASFLFILFSIIYFRDVGSVNAKLADRGRMVKHRNEISKASKNMNSRLHTSRGVTKSTRPNREYPVEGPSYRRNTIDLQKGKKPRPNLRHARDSNSLDPDESNRQLSQLSGCCTSYSKYQANNLCYLYGQDCSTGQEPSHDSGDEDCSQEGLSFIGISFSVNTAHGNPYSYQLCDQFPMENIIDRDYTYIMSMDEDGWLVGGGYKSFDYSGKMPYIDSSHTELLRIGSLDPDFGGTSIEQVYSAMARLSYAPFSVFPEYVKGGGQHSGDDEEGVPSGDVTLIVSIVEEFSDDNGDSDYDIFLDDLFDAMDNVGGGPCMDDHDTDPHVSMSRGVKFKSSYHQTQYFYTVNLEVAVWQAMYPKGAVIGTSGAANFPPEKAGRNRVTVGYGNLYFFFDRANITKSFAPNRGLTDTENYYATMYNNGFSESFYQKVTNIGFDYSGSGSGGVQYYEHNPYAWNARMAKHDMTDGWDLPPNCNQEGEAFLGIPLSTNSDSKLTQTSTFQSQFDFEVLLDRNFTYMKSFGTNHGWLVGEQLGNGAGSIVDKDTAHIPLFYIGTTNVDQGGMSLSDIIKIMKKINFGTLYIKPAFVFQDDDGSVKLQFEADSKSALAYLYDNLCKMIGISWNYESPQNDYGIYTQCAMHAAGDRATYGCGPDNAGSGGFCPQLTLAYRVNFQSEDHAAAYFARCNNYVDYWRNKYPSGVAVGTNKFCPTGGCIGLFLNRYDLFNVFKPDLGGSWVEYNGGTMAPTVSPAPSFGGGCRDPKNFHLDKCFRRNHARRATVAAWESLGVVGQLSVLLVTFMATTLVASLFMSRARKRKSKNESYIGFFMRDVRRKKKKKLKKKKDKKKKKHSSLEEDILEGDTLGEDSGGAPPPRPGRGKSRERGRSRSKSRGRSKSRAKSTDKSSKNLDKEKSEKKKKKDKDKDKDKEKEREKEKEKKGRSGRSRSRSKSAKVKQRSESSKRGTKDDKKKKRKEDSRRQLV